MAKTFVLSFLISGTGFASVEADTEDEAIKKFRAGQYLEEPEIDDWDINSKPERGGYLDVQEETGK